MNGMIGAEAARRLGLMEFSPGQRFRLGTWPRCSRRAALLTVSVVLMLAAVMPGQAVAHDTAGVPYHTYPMPAGMWVQYSMCVFHFNNPTVYGFTSENVYWRLYAVRAEGGVWKYRYSTWRWAATSPSPTYLFWRQGSDSATGPQQISLPAGKFWIGYQIYYSSNGYTHSALIGNSQVTC